MCILNRLLFLILFGFLFFGPESYGRADEPLKVDNKVRQIRIGIAITPKNFPAHTITNVDETFPMARELGDHAVFIYLWSEPNREVARLMVEKSRNAGLIPILSISPTTLYKETYREVKRVSPDTKVFISFQWEWGRIYDAREMHKIKERSKVIDIFRSELDVVGLTTYPSPFHASPVKLPLDYYFWIYHQYQKHRRGPPHGVGWPTAESGGEHEQQAFIRRLPGLLDRENVSVIARALLHDVDLAEFDADLNTVGLVTSYGQRKIGYEAFKALTETLP